MRGRALALALVLCSLPFAGCITRDDGGDNGLPEERFTVPSNTGGVGADDASTECPFLEVRTDRATGFRPGDAARVNVTLVNCTNETLTPVLPLCPKPGVLEISVTVDGESWYLGKGPSLSRDVPDRSCEAVAHEIPPGETVGVDVGWNGRYATSGCDAFRCGDDAWAAPGDHVVHAMLVAGDGTTWTANETVRVLAPDVPPFTQDGEVTLLIEDAYARGDTVSVRVRNDGDRAYEYTPTYAACYHVTFYNETGYPFMVPEGTHCDLVTHRKIEPGETVTLFEWGLEECVVDRWGCAESRPLPPGTYHLAGRFHHETVPTWDPPKNMTRTGATFRVT